MIIYKTTNLLNNKIYIGKDVNNKSTYYGSGLYISRAIKCYGKHNFKKEIIDTAITHQELCEKEKYWIAFYNSTDPKIGYNICKGGIGSYGRKQKASTRRKIGKTKIGNQNFKGGKHTEHAKMLMSIAHKGQISSRKGITLSELTKKRIRDSKKANPQSNPFKGKHHTVESRIKISESNKGKRKGRPLTEQDRKNKSIAGFKRYEKVRLEQDIINLFL